MIKQIPLIHLNHTKGSLWWPSKIGFKFGHKSTHITRCALSRIRHLFLNCYITFRITAFKTKLYYFKSFPLPIALIVLVFKAFLTAFNPTAWWVLGYNPTTASVTEKAFYLFIYLFIYLFWDVSVPIYFVFKTTFWIHNMWQTILHDWFEMIIKKCWCFFNRCASIRNYRSTGILYNL